VAWCLSYRACFRVIAVVGLMHVAQSPALAQYSTVGESEVVTWSCTGSPCPWGTWLEGHALVWPATEGALTSRHGYTTTGGVYLPADRANGATIWIDAGTATLYAGYPDSDSHRVLAVLSDSNYFDVSDLSVGE